MSNKSNKLNKLSSITQKLENFSSNTAGILDVIGTKIEVDKKGSVNQKSLENLAKSLEIYSDKRYETARYFFIKNGECIRHVAVSTQTPSSTAIMPDKDFLYKLKDYAEKTDSQIVFCHNHPSGYVEPSKQDIELTEYVQNILNTGNESNKQYFAGHVILDHNTYGIYTPQNQWISVSNGKYYPIEQTPFNYQISKNEYNIQIKKDTDLIKLSDFIKDKINKENEWNKSEWIPIAFTNIHGIVKNVEFISINEFNNQKELQDKLRDIGRENNSENVYFLPYKNNYNQMSLCENFAKQTGLVKDIYFENDMNGFDLSEYSGGNLFPNTIKNEIKIEDTENFTKEEYLSARENNHNKKINEINNKQIQGEKAMSTALPEVKYLSFENNNVFKMGNAKKIDSLREDLINQKLITPEDDVILISASQLKEKGLEIKENIPSVSISIPIDIQNNKYTYENYYSITSFPELIKENNKEIDDNKINPISFENADDVFSKFQELTSLPTITQEQSIELLQINNYCEYLVNKVDVSKLTPEQATQFDYFLRIAMQNPSISNEEKKHRLLLQQEIEKKLEEYNNEEELDLKNKKSDEIEKNEVLWSKLIFEDETQKIITNTLNDILKEQPTEELKKEIIDTISLSSLIDLKSLNFANNSKIIIGSKVLEKCLEFKTAVNLEYLKQVAKNEVLNEQNISNEEYEELLECLERINSGNANKKDEITKKEANLINEINLRASSYNSVLLTSNVNVSYQNKEFLQNAINAVNGVQIQKAIIKDAHIQKITSAKRNVSLKKHWEIFSLAHPNIAAFSKFTTKLGFSVIKTAAVASIAGTTGLAVFSAYNTVKQINKNYKHFKNATNQKSIKNYLKYLKEPEHRSEAIGLAGQIAASTISGIFGFNTEASSMVIAGLTGRRFASTITSTGIGIVKGINAHTIRKNAINEIKEIYSKYNKNISEYDITILEQGKTNLQIQSQIASLTDKQISEEDIVSLTNLVNITKNNHTFKSAVSNILGAGIGLAISTGAVDWTNDKIHEIITPFIPENPNELVKTTLNNFVNEQVNDNLTSMLDYLKNNKEQLKTILNPENVFDLQDAKVDSVVQQMQNIKTIDKINMKNNSQNSNISDNSNSDIIVKTPNDNANEKKILHENSTNTKIQENKENAELEKNQNEQIIDTNLFNRNNAYNKYQKVPDFAILDEKTGKSKEITNARFHSIDENNNVFIVCENENGSQETIKIPEDKYKKIIDASELFNESVKNLTKDSLSYIRENEQFRASLGLDKDSYRSNTCANFSHNLRILINENPNLNFNEIMELADKELTQKMNPTEKKWMNVTNKQYATEQAMLYRRIYDNNFIEGQNIDKKINYKKMNYSVGQNIKLSLSDEIPNTSYIIDSIDKKGSFILSSPNNPNIKFKLSKKEIYQHIKQIEKENIKEFKKHKQVDFYER